MRFRVEVDSIKKIEGMESYIGWDPQEAARMVAFLQPVAIRSWKISGLVLLRAPINYRGWRSMFKSSWQIFLLI